MSLGITWGLANNGTIGTFSNTYIAIKEYNYNNIKITAFTKYTSKFSDC